MNIETVSIAIMAAFLSGAGTALINSIQSSKKEKIRQSEREQDQLKLDISNLKIELYKLEKELTEWKDKYYNAIQDLIEIKAQLENALIQLNIDEMLDFNDK